MGGGVWEQTNLGGVKVWGDSCGGQATSGMCRRLRSTTVRWFPPTRPWIPVLGVYIFSPCCVAFARSSLSFFFLRALSGVFLTLVYCYLQDLCSFLKAALLGLPWRLDLGAALEIGLCCAGFMVKLVLFYLDQRWDYISYNNFWRADLSWDFMFNFWTCSMCFCRSSYFWVRAAADGVLSWSMLESWGVSIQEAWMSRVWSFKFKFASRAGREKEEFRGSICFRLLTFDWNSFDVLL